MFVFNSRVLQVMMGLLAAAVLTVGCSESATKATDPTDSSKEASNSKATSKEPVTLTFYNNNANIDDYYTKYIEAHIKKKLPHITINYIKSAKGSTLPELITAGTIPDLIYLVSTQLSELNELQILDDLTPLTTAHKFNLSSLQNGLSDSIRTFGDNNKLIAMPWGLSNFALYYNRDIFDRLGVSYPKDGMTWDEVLELTKRTTRNVDGVQYRGMDFTPNFILGYNQLSLAYVDPKTDKSMINNYSWKKIFELFGSYFRIAGNEGKTPGSFLETRTVAMTAGPTLFNHFIAMQDKGESFNFDIVSFPTFKEAPKTGLQTVFAGFGITPLSKNKDAAMQIISLMLSDEVQREGAEIYRLPVVKNDQFLDSLGKSYPSMAKINSKALTLQQKS